MKSKANEFFGDSVKKSITDTIAKVEKKTSGEVAVMVVDESDSYREAAALGAFCLSAVAALLLSMIIAVVLHHREMWSFGSSEYVKHLAGEIIQYTSIWYFIPLLFLLYFPSAWAMRLFPAMKLLFISKKRVEEAVRERAVRAFYEQGLYRTRDETGVLIFISLLEHRVWVLGDRAINEKIPSGFWVERALELSQGMKDHAYGEALCGVIERCGEELARHFPIKADDTNEIPNEVIT